MKRISILLLVISMMLGLGACGTKTPTGQEQYECEKEIPTWQEQYDLGVRYLEEGSYEEAIIAFTTAIEIDPKQALPYIDLANTYLKMTNFEAADGVVSQGMEACGELEELTSLRGKIYRDSQQNYNIDIPVDYSIVYQEGNEIHIGSVSYEVDKENNQYKNQCSSQIEGRKRTIYGSLVIKDIMWNGGERVYACYPADSMQNEDILAAAPMRFSETYVYKQHELDFENYFEKYSVDGDRMCSSSISGLGKDETGHLKYTLQEMLTTSKYMTLAVYDESGERTGLLVIELQPSTEVLEMLARHTVFEEIGV